MKPTRQNIEDLAKILRMSEGLAINKQRLLDFVNDFDFQVCFKIRSAELNHKYLEKPLVFYEHGGYYYYDAG